MGKPGELIFFQLMDYVIASWMVKSYIQLSYDTLDSITKMSLLCHYYVILRLRFALSWSQTKHAKNNKNNNTQTTEEEEQRHTHENMQTRFSNIITPSLNFRYFHGIADRVAWSGPNLKPFFMGNQLIKSTLTTSIEFKTDKCLCTVYAFLRADCFFFACHP